MNTKYGRLVNGRIEYAPNALETADGVKAITIRDLIKTALRCRPDRVIVGEVRSEEAIDMLQALNIGQDGSMSTIHANNARDSLLRLETCAMYAGFDLPLNAIRNQVVAALEYVRKRLTGGNSIDAPEGMALLPGDNAQQVTEVK